MDNEHTEWMEQIERELSTPPAVVVPADFAARVMGRLPAQKRPRRVIPPTALKAQFARMAMIGAMLMLVAGMIVLAPLTTGSSTWYMLQVLLLLQLGALVLLFGHHMRARR